uniref:Succinate dehydrogenase [ubiquinone] cytochrome b small subunit n=1 Tax=Ditylenchus dipsaci TaxID=166011 RepID=A0A915EAK3_9BILA
MVPWFISLLSVISYRDIWPDYRMMISKLCKLAHRGGLGSKFRFLVADRPKFSVPSLASMSTVKEAAPAKSEEVPLGGHSTMFKLERIWTVASFPIFPAAYFFHTPTMDFLLTAAIVLHVHWGFIAVVQDYARAIVVGDKFSVMAPKLVIIVSALLLAVLLNFNYNDVGLTKAFEMVYSL